MKKTMRIVLLLCLSSCIGILSYAQQRTVTGTVTDEQGTGLPAVSYVVKGSSTGGVTNDEGGFSIIINSNDAVIEFSAVGYLSQSVSVGNQTSLSVVLSTADNQLEGVVVTAMGIKKDQRKLGYAVSTVKGEDIVKTSPTNFASALYGKAPGIAINSNPGGATSAVGITIRGLNSIYFPQQPLLVVDGVITRNGDANNDGYWSSPRLQGNGILDINPDNIESINILRGAAASALYGSDAASGVIVVTTKNGSSKKGLGIDVNYSYNSETVAILPKMQNVFGPGWEKSYALSSVGVDEDLWLYADVDGQHLKHPQWNSQGMFGPEFDGSQVYGFDGKMHPYIAYPNNPKNFYETGYSSIGNIAISNSNERGAYRFSYTRNDYKSIAPGSKQQKNTFNLNSTYKLSDKLTVDLVANYVVEKVHNRPWRVDRIQNNYSGFLSQGIDVGWFRQLYKTADGYKYITSANQAQNPETAFKLPVNGFDIMDYYWTQLMNSNNETTNRLMGSLTASYQLTSDLNLRGRLGTDYTGLEVENKEHNTVPLSIGNSGYYSTNMNRYNFLYGDVLLSYSKRFSDHFTLNASAGYQARQEDYRWSAQNTDGGLSQENWFSFSASKNPSRGSSTRATLRKDGLFGILGFELNNYLFVEGSLRQERTSSLYPGNNVFYYPSASAAFELSNAFTMPAAFNYSKLRISYGEVGNPPPQYVANVVYNANSVNGVQAYNPNTSYGSDELKNERKAEFEIGWENKFFKNRLGLDLTYYTNRIHDMILPMEVAATTGVTNLLVNIGDMRNRGFEIGLSGRPVASDFIWESRLNLAFNKNEVTRLMPGVDRYDISNLDNGSLYVVADVGRPAGEILTYDLTRNADGSLLISDAGYHVPNWDTLISAGNTQPKLVGGFINTFDYKGFSLNVVLDFNWGSQAYSPSLQYMRSMGMLEETLFGRNKENGGIPYYFDNDYNLIGVDPSATAGPNGEKIYWDGMILEGKKADGTENTTIIEAPLFYQYAYYWGAYPNGAAPGGTYKTAVFDNNYIKFREVSLSYSLPSKLLSRMGFNNTTISVFGRNLFYVYRSIKDFDPEGGAGTNFKSRTNIGGTLAPNKSIGASIRFNF